MATTNKVRLLLDPDYPDNDEISGTKTSVAKYFMNQYAGNNLLPQQEEGNIEMNRLLQEEQRQPFMRNPQGTNPIPLNLLSGKVSDGNIMTAVPPHLQGQYGKFYGTNVYDGENAGLLGQMGVSPEQITQAKTQQAIINKPMDITAKQDAAWKDAQALIASGKVAPDVMNKEFLTVFGQDALDRVRGISPKKYEPKTQSEALDFERKKKEQELGLVGEKERQKALGTAKAKFEADYPKVSGTMSALNKQWDLVDETIDKALKIISPFTAGVGSWAKIIPATPQKTLNGYLETIRANIGFDKLQQMRTDSPTGGALGQVSDFENRLLQAVKGSLDQGLNPSVLRQNIQRIKEDLANIRKDRNNAFEKDYSSFGASVSTPQGTPMQGAKQAPDGKWYIQINGQWNLIGE